MPTPKRTLLLACIFLITIAAHAMPAERYYYQVRVYHLATVAQQQRVEQFLQSAYLPAMHRAGIKKIGVFKTMDADTAKRIYVFIPYRNWKQIEQTTLSLEKDKQYNIDGKDYLEAAYNDLPYQRIETILLHAFEGMPEPSAPNLAGPKKDRVYELRNYEGPTEKYFANKMQMFNKGEMDIFNRLGFNAVFYGEAIAGSNMPNLMYMTSFDNKVSRDEHWKNFGSDPAWKQLSALPEYQNNVSKIFIYFLYPAEYSEF